MATDFDRGVSVRAVRLVAVMLAVCAAAAAPTACGEVPPPRVAARRVRPAPPVRDFLDARLAAALAADTAAAAGTESCPYFGMLLWPVDVPRGPSAGVTGCRLDVGGGDTTHYAYRDSAGRVLVAGWEVHYAAEHIGHEVRTDSARLRRTVDSLRVALERRYGPFARCPDSSDFTPWGGHVYRWDVGDSAGVLLESSDAEASASVGVEAHARAITCRSFAGPPAAR